GFRFGDVVLNDGAATGRRKLNEQEVPVFNCLALLRASTLSTWVAEVDLSSATSPGESAVALLEELAQQRALAAEDWSTSIRILCKACSGGGPYSDHDHPVPEVGPRRRLAIAAPDASHAEGLLEDWRSRAG